jgi:hypothetical protein
MITRDEALNAREFHCGECTRIIGPRGGVVTHTEVWRRNGKTQTWVTRPDEFSVPVRYGFTNNRRNYGYITEDNAQHFHTADNCPLNEAN